MSKIAGFVEWMERGIISAVAALLRRSSLAMLQRYGAFVGSAVWRVSAKRRRATIQRIKRHLPEASLLGTTPEAMALSSWREAGKSYFEFFHAHCFRANRLGVSVRTPDPDMVARFIGNQRPVVAVTAHFGSWELLGGILGSAFLDSRPRAILVRMHKHRPLRDFMTNQRGVPGVQIVDKANSTPLALRFLAQNGVIALLGDHNTFRSEAVFLPFLGREAAVNKGPAMLAIQGKALVWPIFLARTPENGWTHTLYMGEPLDATELDGTVEKRVETICVHFTRAIEKTVLAHPEQWYWLHDRWKTRPGSEGATGVGMTGETAHAFRL